MTDEEQTQAELERLLRQIAQMCEGDVDVFLQDLREYPCGEEWDRPLREACLRRLQELAGRPITDEEADLEAGACRVVEVLSG